MPDKYIKPSDHFNVVTYTGNGGTQSINVGFQPDLVWIKSRNRSFNHELYDAVRGPTKRILSESANAESTSTRGVTSFNPNGFTQGGETEVGADGVDYVAWCWKANGAGVANTDGTIASTVSANTSAGFSVVTYTGQEPTAGTIGHGLGVAPSVIITKNRSGAGNWGVYHKYMDASSPQSYYMQLNSTSARINATDVWNNTAPTSTVFSVGNAGTTNTSGASYVAYCFSEVAGYSKVGSYTGNGSSDGTFVYTGFRPAYIMVKRSDSTGAWFVLDNKRDTYNYAYHTLNPNASDSEYSSTSNAYDFLSNGFKLRQTNADQNASGGTYIYMAFAEAPFKYANAR